MKYWFPNKSKPQFLVEPVHKAISSSETLSFFITHLILPFLVWIWDGIGRFALGKSVTFCVMWWLARQKRRAAARKGVQTKKTNAANVKRQAETSPVELLSLNPACSRERRRVNQNR